MGNIKSVIRPMLLGTALLILAGCSDKGPSGPNHPTASDSPTAPSAASLASQAKPSIPQTLGPTPTSTFEFSGDCKDGPCHLRCGIQDRDDFDGHSGDHERRHQDSDDGTVKLEWEKAHHGYFKHPDGYWVFRASSAQGTYVLIQTLTRLGDSDQDLDESATDQPGPGSWCYVVMAFGGNPVTASEATEPCCLVVEGGKTTTPTPTPANTRTVTPTDSNTASPSPTHTATLTGTATATATSTATSTASDTATDSATATSSATASSTSSPSPSSTSTSTSTATSTATATPFIFSTPTATETPGPHYILSYSIDITPGPTQSITGGYLGIAATVEGPATLISISDSNNNRVESYDSSTATWTVFGGPATGNGQGQFNFPVNLAFDGSGDLFVADDANSRIQKYNGSAWSTASLSGNPMVTPGAFVLPTGMEFSPGSGKLEVFDSGPGLGNIETFSTASAAWNIAVHGGYPGTSGLGSGVDSSGTTFYVADPSNNAVYRAVGSSWGIFKNSAGTGPGQVNIPNDVKVDNQGNVFVMDSGNGRVEEFTAGGSLVTIFGNNGPTGPILLNAAALALDNLGNVYVVNTQNNRINVFSFVP